MYKIAVLQHTCSIILLGILESMGETTQIIINLQTVGLQFYWTWYFPWNFWRSWSDANSTLEKISLIINVNPTYQRTPLFSIYKHGKTLLSLNKALCSYLATLWTRTPWCKTDFIQSSYFTDFLVLKILSIVELLLLAVIAPASNLKTMQLNHQIMDEGSVDVMLT